MFLSDEGPTLETLDFIIRIGSTPTFLCFDLDTDIVRPVREIVQRRKKTTGNFVRRQWNWGYSLSDASVLSVRPKCNFVRRNSLADF